MDFKEGMPVKIKGVSFTYRVCSPSPTMEKMVGKTYIITGDKFVLERGWARVNGWCWDCRDLEPVINIEKFSQEDKTIWQSLFE